MNNNTITIPSQHYNTVTIPQGWSSLPINEVFEFIGTSSFSRNDLNYEADEDNIYYIHYGDIHATYKNAVLDFETETRIPVLNKDIKPSAHLLKEGDLVIADASEDYEGIGEALEVYNLGDKKALAGLHTFALRDNSNKTAHGYRAYIFKNHEVKNRLKTIATGSKVYGISKGNLTKFKIILPPYQEQQKIAQILATWDKAIVLQQQIITKKRHSEKNLIHQLITGQKRLKGFSNGWDKKMLGEIGELTSSKRVYLSDYVEEGIPFFRGKEISELKEGKVIKDILFISKSAYNNFKENYGVPVENDILITAVGTIGNVYRIQNNNPFYFKDGNLIWIKNIKESSNFIEKLLNFEYKKIYNSAIGSNQKALTIVSLKRIHLFIPPLIEQIAIARVLETSEKELRNHEQQLVAMQEQKKGLMQQLLTGKLRVKI